MRSAARAVKRLSILCIALSLLVPMIAGCGRAPMSERVTREGIPEGDWLALSDFIKAASDTEAERGPSQANTLPGEPVQPRETRPNPSDQSPVIPLPDPQEQPSDIPVMEISSASRDFDFNLLKQAVTESSSSNVVLSPFSVRMALAMAYNGAGGPAEEAMAEVLDFEGSSLEEVNVMMHDLLLSLRQQEEELQLEIANSFWGQKEETFFDDLIQACRDHYGAELQRVDFKDPEIVQVINDWAKDNTHGRIPQIVSDHKLIEDNLAAWMNAVYFKAKWTLQFDEDSTRDDDFILADGRRIKVPLMRKSAELEYLENEDFQAVCLPYGDRRMGMYVFLPREGKDLNGLYASLNRDNWERWIQAFDKREGTIYLPRFNVGYEIDLTDILKAMGMAPAFEDDYALPKVIESKPWMAIKLVLHKTVIEVNEAGTEGAAVTYVGMVPTCAPPQPSEPFTMKVDRPFFFAIRDNQTGALLFMGSIVDPS